MKSADELGIGGAGAPDGEGSQERSSTRGSLAHRGGVAFFWVLNDECDRPSLLRQLDAFEQAGTEGLILHPRNGLLLPYGGEEWFELIHWLVAECLKRGIEPILYDEDPYPSGSASGRIVAEHPECRAYEIVRYAAPDELAEGELFLFPSGRLCWVGIVFPEGDDRAPIDLTARVGMIRRHWEKAEWNSRWYYPDTPIYPHPRAFAHLPEFSLRIPTMSEGGKLVAFVAQPVEASNEWGSLADSLNPKATQLFLEYTHERYQRALGAELGRGVASIFTDEPKPPSCYSWTLDLFESFERAYGYDLRPRLELLFGQGEGAEGARVRMDYREWIVGRFNDAWMKPVAQWCQAHGLALIGHLSPEEDPVNQAATIGNIFPPLKHLLLGGYDLIIPAIGDARHPLLNVAALISASAAQQGGKPGVCCESLGAFGVNIAMEVVGRTLAWQVLHGATLGVIHGAFSSQLGLRRYEAPDDYGTSAPNWGSIAEVCRKLRPFFQSTASARQQAPVAILWPIRSFHAAGVIWQEKEVGRRGDLLRLMQRCLENQVGIHFVDEADLVEAKVHNGKLCMGRAMYEWVLVPSLTVLGQPAYEALLAMNQAGVSVASVGTLPGWLRERKGHLTAIAEVPWKRYSFDELETELLPALPQLIRFPAEIRADFHASLWERDGEKKLFLMQMGEDVRQLEIGGESLCVAPGELLWLREEGQRWVLVERFDPAAYPDVPAPEERLLFPEWEMAVPGQTVVKAGHPLGVWQLLRTSGPRHLPMIATGTVHLGGGKMADKVIYTAKTLLPPWSEKITLCVEPTLMRGRFTLEAGGQKWDFAVADTDRALLRIDLSGCLKAGETAELRFTLHEPEAMDGIKHSPHLLL